MTLLSNWPTDIPFFLLDKFSNRNPRFVKEVVFFLLNVNLKCAIFHKSELTQMAFYTEILRVLELLLNPNELVFNKILVVKFLKAFFQSFNDDYFEKFLGDASLVLRSLLSELIVSAQNPDYQFHLVDLLDWLRNSGIKHAIVTNSKNRMTALIQSCSEMLDGFANDSWRVKKHV